MKLGDSYFTLFLAIHLDKSEAAWPVTLFICNDGDSGNLTVGRKGFLKLGFCGLLR